LRGLVKQRPSLGEGPLTLAELWHILWRRSSVLFCCLTACVGLAVFICIFSTRRYQATGEIQVQKDSTDALGLDTMIGGSQEASDALDANITLQTQADLLESDTLANLV
jgi:polysaccharide biosynthesis transport protein